MSGNSNEVRDSGSSNNGQVANNEAEEHTRNAPDPPRGGMFFDVAKSLIVRAIFIYFITSLFRRPAAPETGNVATPKVPAHNCYENGTVLDMYVFMSEFPYYVNFNDRHAMIWRQVGLVYGDWYSGKNNDGTYEHSIKFQPSEGVKNNGSLYIHVYFLRQDQGFHKIFKDNFSGPKVVHASRMLNKYKKRKFVKTQNLLTGESALSEDDIKNAEKTNSIIASHWHPNLTLNLVTDFTNWIEGTLPHPIDEHITFTDNGNSYKPILFINDFWNLQRDYFPINETTKELTLSLTYQPLSLFKWQMYATHSIRSTLSSNYFESEANHNDDDMDSLKESLLEVSPYLLAATIIVSILHSIFELLAFKNDIQFWKDRESLEGLSVRLVFFSVFQSFIVLLYVFDNDTNTIVRISCAVGLCIEIWKINKVVDISLDRENKILGLFPRPIFADKGSYVESSTKEYDQLAFKYLSWVLFPLLSAYAVYSLLYQEHTGWYSWLLNMVYGFLLTFGFITMTPQLFINYKLKSVAHLPWRMMTYKCLNTFIDDVFAFVIKMPTMYRLGCFRDDVVFFIFLYQRWIYKTDPTRVNEYGYSGVMEEKKLEAALAGDNLAIASIPADDTADDASAPDDDTAKDSDASGASVPVNEVKSIKAKKVD